MAKRTRSEDGWSSRYEETNFVNALRDALRLEPLPMHNYPTGRKTRVVSGTGNGDKSKGPAT